MKSSGVQSLEFKLQLAGIDYSSLKAELWLACIGDQFQEGLIAQKGPNQEEERAGL